MKMKKGQQHKSVKRGVKDFGLRALQRTRSCALKPSVIRFFFLFSQASQHFICLFMFVAVALSVRDPHPEKTQSWARSTHLHASERET